MHKQFILKQLRTTKRALRKWRRAAIRFHRRTGGKAAAVAVVAVVVACGMAYKSLMTTPQVDPAVYRPLLDTIAQGESRGNYNAYFGNAANNKIRFTEMTVAEVLQWQKDFVDKGSPSSAVGRYQIIRPTLLGLVEQLGIDKNALYDTSLQDQFAVALLERRGAREYIAKELSREEFAANLAKEWAALPKIAGDNPEQSYYAGDGLNKVQISINEVYAALGMITR